jgi:hypothetical protein
MVVERRLGPALPSRPRLCDQDAEFEFSARRARSKNHGSLSAPAIPILPRSSSQKAPWSPLLVRGAVMLRNHGVEEGGVGDGANNVARIVLAIDESVRHTIMPKTSFINFVTGAASAIWSGSVTAAFMSILSPCAV